MKKLTLTILAILLATFFTTAQTIIPAGPVEGTWTINGSPYEIQGAINVVFGATLTIDPGVEVQFNTTESFEIIGCLLALGNEQDSILFTSYDPFEKWGGISWPDTYSSNDSSKIDYCIFENSFAYGTQVGYNSGGAIRVSNFDKLSIQHSTFRYNLVDQYGSLVPCGGALAVWNSSISISHCIFHNNIAKHGGAVMIYLDCETIIDNCLFYNNETYDGDGGAIEVYESVGAYFINCTFVDNHASIGGGAIDSYISMATLTNCILWGNTADVEGDQVYISSSMAGLNFYHCNSQGGDTAFGGYANNGEIINLIKDDPIFYEIVGYPYGFREGSPCMNLGSLNTLYLPENWGCPCMDLADNTRIQLLTIDLGAYEAFPPTGTNESTINKTCNLIAFPNPITDNLTLTYQLQNTSVVNISLYSITGKKLEILSNQMIPVGEHQQYIDMTSLSVGTYFIKLQIGDEVVTKKVVKM